VPKKIEKTKIFELGRELFIGFGGFRETQIRLGASAALVDMKCFTASLLLSALALLGILG